MGAFTPLDDVWYPDEDDTAEQNVNLATQAASIEEGIGARLRHQELAIGLKASLNSSAWTIPGNGILPQRVPYAISGERGDFTQGLTITNGIITVATAGMYLVTATLGTLGAINGAGIKLFLDKNGTFLAGAESPMVAPTWGNTQVTTVLNCVPGDTILTRGQIQSTTTSLACNGESTHLSVVLVQALPL
jgi:hypothetical protein